MEYRSGSIVRGFSVGEIRIPECIQIGMEGRRNGKSKDGGMENGIRTLASAYVLCRPISPVSYISGRERKIKGNKGEEGFTRGNKMGVLS